MEGGKTRVWCENVLSLCAVGKCAGIFTASAAAIALTGTSKAEEGEALQVQKGSMVAAGAVVASGTNIPPGQLWAGVPAKFLRDLKPNEASFLGVSADTYHRLSEEHAEQAEKRPPFA